MQHLIIMLCCIYTHCCAALLFSTYSHCSALPYYNILLCSVSPKVVLYQSLLWLQYSIYHITTPLSSIYLYCCVLHIYPHCCVAPNYIIAQYLTKCCAIHSHDVALQYFVVQYLYAVPNSTVVLYVSTIFCGT
jgi:hypothetical protein